MNAKIKSEIDITPDQNFCARLVHPDKPDEILGTFSCYRVALGVIDARLGYKPIYVKPNPNPVAV